MAGLGGLVAEPCFLGYSSRRRSARYIPNGRVSIRQYPAIFKIYDVRR